MSDSLRYEYFGASYKIFDGDELLAFRPDEESAQNLIRQIRRTQSESSDDWMERDLENRGMSELLRQFRREGWRVAIHNDYMQDGQLRTFWLLTFGNWCVRGEGPTDYAALQICRHGIARLQANANTEAKP